MEITAAVLRGIAVGLLVIAAPISLWQLVIGIRGVFPMLRRPVREDKEHRFAVLICARNEEAVIGKLLDSLFQQDYSRSSYTVFVVADNCTDGTAETARRHGALVYERADLERVGKGFALHWAFERIRQEYPGCFDAAAVFDADNLVSPDFLTKMNDALCAGADVAQGYRDTKNVEDSAVSACYAIYWHMLTRFYHRARYNWGLSCMVCGTGFVFKWPCIAEGWNTHTLAEDSEFSIQQVSEGRRIVPVYDAVFYDEQPTTWGVSIRQRYRWLVGGIQCLKYELGHSLQQLFKGRFAALDGIVYMFSLIALGLTLFVGAFWVAALVAEAFYMDPALFRLEWIGLAVMAIVSCAGLWLIALLTVLLEHKPLRRYWKGVLCFPLFLLPMAYLALMAMFHPRTEWKPIAHSRASSIADMADTDQGA